MHKPKITVKKNLIIFHDEHDWLEIFQRIVNEHGPKIHVSYVFRRELGFSVRRHRGLMSANVKKDPTLMYYQDQIHLDFYTESAQSWFQLRYL